jgi:hypothetical protein
MQKYGLIVDNPDHRLCYTPVVAALLHFKLKNPPARLNKRRKLDWNEIISGSEFVEQIQDRSKIKPNKIYFEKFLVNFVSIF